jgi:hypothetical protein
VIITLKYWLAPLLVLSSILAFASPIVAPDTSHGEKHLLFIRAVFPDDATGSLPTDGQLNANAGNANK